MNKKYIKIGILSILSLVIIYFIIFVIQNYTLSSSFSKEFNENFKKNNTYFIRCNWNIFNPEFAYASEIGGGLITFQKSKNMFYQTEEEWDNNEVGGTTISNTTFPQLLKMVKEDCSQFQKAKGDRNDKDINWSYSPKIQEKTSGEIELKKKSDEEWNRKVDSGEITPARLEDVFEIKDVE